MKTRSKYKILVVMLATGLAVMLIALFLRQSAVSSEKDNGKISLAYKGK